MDTPEGAPASGGIPSTMVYDVAKRAGRWVRLSEFVEHNKAGAMYVEETFGKEKAYSIQASVDATGRATARPSGYKGVTETFVSVLYVAAAPGYAVRPSLKMHENAGEWPFLAAEALKELGATDQELGAMIASAQPSERMHASIVEGALKPGKEGAAGTWVYVSVATAMRSMPRLHGRILEAFSPGCRQVRLPAYTAEDMDEGKLWVSTADLRRVLGDKVEEGDDTEVFKGLTKASPSEFRYLKPSHGALVGTKGNHPKDRLSTPFVSAEWVLARYGEQAERAAPNVPVAFGPHPPNKGTKGAPKASKKPGVVNPKVTSVKCTISKRLRNPSARAVIEEIVDDVTRASRFGSHLINLHCIRLLDAGDGVLPPRFELGTDLFKKCVSAALEGSMPSDREVARTLREHMPSLRAGRFAYRQRGNTTKYDATTYIGNVKATFAMAGPSRVACLLKCAARLHPCEKGTVHRLVRYIEWSTDSRPDAPSYLLGLADSYRKLYSRLGLDQGFRVPDKEGAPEKMRAILMLYWRVNRDHAELQEEALRQGWTLREESSDPSDDADGRLVDERVWSRKSFALLPVNSLKRRHVRIDNDVFRTHIYKRLHGANAHEDFEEAAFLSLFVTAEDGKRRRDVRTLRSAAKGWSVGATFSTDGTSVSMIFKNPERGETHEEKVARGKVRTTPEDMVREFGANDRKMGVDPGRVNLWTTYEKLPDGTSQVKQLTRATYYHESGEDERKLRRERRHNRYGASMAAVSATRRRTSDGEEFARYASAVWTHHDELQLAYGGRSACSESFASYRDKMRVLDGFFASLGEHPKGGRFTIGLGNANFDSSGKGERSVPTTFMKHRAQTAHGTKMDVIDVDEFHTTKLCVLGPWHAELGVPYRMLEGGRSVPDRDVRFCSSESLLGSHPCPPPASLCAGLTKPVGTEWVCRDGNSAACMELLMGLPHCQRPLAFQRSNPRPPCMSAALEGPCPEKTAC